MAYFRKRSGAWEATIKKKGHGRISRTFDTRADAETWAKVTESELVRGIYIPRKEAENTTLSEALDRYEKEVAVHKKGYWQEKYKIAYWKKSNIGTRCLSAVRPADLAAWRDGKLKESAPTTVNRLLIVLSHLFTIAIKEWGMGELVNPVMQIRRPKSTPGRDRRLKFGELERIIESSGSEILPPIIRFALETGMRRSEIAGMTWNMVDLQKRTVSLSETKNGEKRIVPLSTEALRVLSALSRRIDGAVWGIDEKGMGITQAFIRALSRARSAYEKECEEKEEKPDPSFLADLTFHDLRHEATSRFFEKGFNPMEVSAITGHKTLQMLKRYTHLKAEDLAERLK